MPGLLGIMPGEWGGQPGILSGGSGWESALSGSNPMFNMGLGILANNSGHYGALGPALGGGMQQGLQQTQLARQQAMQNKMYEIKMKEIEQEQEQEKRRAEFLQNYGQPNSTQQTVTQGAPTFQNAPQGTDAPNFNMQQVPGQETVTETPVFDQAKSLQQALSVGAIDFPTYLQMTQAEKQKSPIKLGKGDRLVDPNSYEELVAPLPDPEEVNPNKPFLVVDGNIVPNKAYQDYEIQKARAGAANNTVSVNTGQKGFDNVLKLRGDFRSEPIYKAHQDVKSAHAQISSSLKLASPAGDLAGATKLMKILDPGSVVRESELGMAMAASGALDRLTNYAQMVVSGNKLTPDQRKDFQKLSDALYAESSNLYNAKRGEYQGIAERNELNTLDVLGAPDELPKKPPAPPKTTYNALPKKAPKGQIVKNPATRERMRFDGMRWKKI